jgi:hypothetical protein
MTRNAEVSAGSRVNISCPRAEPATGILGPEEQEYREKIKENIKE